MAASLALVGCGEHKAAPAPAPSPLDAAAPRRDGRFAGVEGCAWNDLGTGLHGCDAADAALDTPDDPSLREEASRMLGDRSPQGRYLAFYVLLFHGGDADRARLAEVLGHEPDVEARYAMARLAAQSPHGLGPQLLALADDDDVRIRRVVAPGLADVLGVPGVLDKLVALATDDPDAEVRGGACEAVGGLGDASSTEFYRRMLVTDTEPSVYDHCLQGLLRLWSEAGHDDEAAYRLTLTVIEHGPYRPGAPSTYFARAIDGLIQVRKDDPGAWEDVPWVKDSELAAAQRALSRAQDAEE